MKLDIHHIRLQDHKVSTHQAFLISSWVGSIIWWNSWQATSSWSMMWVLTFYIFVDVILLHYQPSIHQNHQDNQLLCLSFRIKIETFFWFLLSSLSIVFIFYFYFLSSSYTKLEILAHVHEKKEINKDFTNTLHTPSSSPNNQNIKIKKIKMGL